MWLLVGSGFKGSFRGDSFGYFFPGTVVLVVLFAAIFATISVIEDRREGFLQGVLVAPVAPASIAFGKVLGGSVLGLLQGLPLLVLVPFAGLSADPRGLLGACGRPRPPRVRADVPRLHDRVVPRVDAGLPRDHESLPHPHVAPLRVVLSRGRRAGMAPGGHGRQPAHVRRRGAPARARRRDGVAALPRPVLRRDRRVRGSHVRGRDRPSSRRGRPGPSGAAGRRGNP